MVSEGGGGRDDPGIGAEIPLQPLEAYWGADIHPQPLEETIQKQVAAWMRLWPHGNSTLQEASGRTHESRERGVQAEVGLLAELGLLFIHQLQFDWK